MVIISILRDFFGSEKSVIHIAEAKEIHTDSKILSGKDAIFIRKSDTEIQQQEFEQVKEIADSLNLKFNLYDLKKINKEIRLNIGKNDEKGDSSSHLLE